MSDNHQDAAAAGSGDASEGPPLLVRAQYVKDLSFENPGAPQSLMNTSGPPDVQVNVNVQVQQLGDADYEVTLTITASAKNGEETAFLVELSYAGVFRLNSVADEHKEPMVLIECPRMLFPFARSIVAEVTREGGFPPLMLQPFDFVALYQQHLAERQARAGGDAPSGES